MSLCTSGLRLLISVLAFNGILRQVFALERKTPKSLSSQDLRQDVDRGFPGDKQSQVTVSLHDDGSLTSLGHTDGQNNHLHARTGDWHIYSSLPTGTKDINKTRESQSQPHILRDEGDVEHEEPPPTATENINKTDVVHLHTKVIPGEGLPPTPPTISRPDGKWNSYNDWQWRPVIRPPWNMPKIIEPVHPPPKPPTIWWKRHENEAPKKPNPLDIFKTQSASEWLVFIFVWGLCLLLHTYEDSSSYGNYWEHCFWLAFWFVCAAAYNVMLVAGTGWEVGFMWFLGYFYEVIFTLENIFVFQVIMGYFKAPAVVMQKTIFVVAMTQTAFQMVLFLGVASVIKSARALPYILGAWLIYVGYLAAKHEDHEDEEEEEEDHKDGKTNLLDVPFAESWFGLKLAPYFGDRLLMRYSPTGSIFTRSPEGKSYVTMTGPLLLGLVIADFCLEVDVILTKIEEIPKTHVAFTSSALCAFAIPDMFIIVREVFARFKLLKYAIGLILVFFGVQMVFSKLFVIPDIIGCGIMVAVVLIFMWLSRLMEACCRVQSIRAEPDFYAYKVLILSDEEMKDLDKWTLSTKVRENMERLKEASFDTDPSSEETPGKI